MGNPSSSLRIRAGAADPSVYGLRGLGPRQPRGCAMTTANPPAGEPGGSAIGAARPRGLERGRGRRGGALGWVRGQWDALMQWLPQGQLLPEHIWRRRHQGIVALLWLHLPALLAFGLLIGGNSVGHVLGDVSLIALFVLGASAERFGVKARVV